MANEKINILGAGLVGSLLSAMLADKGFDVAVFEKREDPRCARVDEGRSINLALSHRGIRALERAGAFDRIKDQLIPMKGRMMHDIQGNLTFQPYGKSGQHINSVSRSGLNKALISLAEDKGASFYFKHKCDEIDLEKVEAHFDVNGIRLKKSSDILIGADGAFSTLRQALQGLDQFEYREHYIEHGYKELTIEPVNGDFALEPNYLHIWPRGNFMLIALPNPDKSFTCTLFFPLEGKTSFATLTTADKVEAFFEKYFSDVIPLITNLSGQFADHPSSSLVTIRTSPWNYKNTLLIGDASHAIVPFYGQGMNAGFEDCRLFMEWGEDLNFNWDKLLPQFSGNRKQDADAIADLALKNFIEMRDKVADDRFLAIKQVEARLQDKYPHEWLPLYSMVTFSDLPYSKALKLGKLQAQVMEALPSGFEPDEVDLTPLIKKFNDLKQDAP